MEYRSTRQCLYDDGLSGTHIAKTSEVRPYSQTQPLTPNTSRLLESAYPGSSSSFKWASHENEITYQSITSVTLRERVASCFPEINQQTHVVKRNINQHSKRTLRIFHDGFQPINRYLPVPADTSRRNITALTCDRTHLLDNRIWTSPH